MVTDCHLAHGRAVNRGDKDEAVLTSDGENGGRSDDVMSQSGANPCSMNCQKTTIQPLIMSQGTYFLKIAY